MATMSFESLRKVYHGGVEALKGITYATSGGTLGLVGPNGAGKTTLMRILSTITRPTAGHVSINEIDVVRYPSKIRSILGYLPQHFDFYPSLRVAEVLAYIADLKRVPRVKRKERIDEALHITGLSELANRRVGSLSGGMKRRLGIAQALLNQPDVLIVDEPTAGLDPEERVRFRSMLSSLSRDRLVVLSTHIVFDVEAVASELIMLANGQILFAGSPADAMRKVEGRVWQVVGNENQFSLPQADQRWILVSSRQEGDKLVVRLIAPEPPSPEAQAMRPTLEDAYLYIVGGPGW